MFFKLIFCQFYEWACKHNYANSPELSAMYLLSFLITINAWSVIMLLSMALRYDAMLFFTTLLIPFLVLAAVSAIIYFLYTKNKKYLVIYRDFSNKYSKVKKRAGLISVVYVLFTVFLFLAIAFIDRVHQRVHL